tara:strand:- start:191 stop:406 length:216 start_codon:yes stop_codon:yes gene_type:complete
MNKSIIDKASLKEQLQNNVLQVFEDVNIMPNVDEKRDGTIALLDAMRHSNEFRDQVLDHMCDVIIETVNKA